MHREVFLIGSKLEVQPRVPGCNQVMIHFLGQQTVWGTPTHMASGANLDPFGELLCGAQTVLSLLCFRVETLPPLSCVRAEPFRRSAMTGLAPNTVLVQRCRYLQLGLGPWRCVAGQAPLITFGWQDRPGPG